MSSEELQECFFQANSLFTDYFNAFLSLPVFPEQIQYKVDHQAFEVGCAEADGQSEKSSHQPIMLIKQDDIMAWLTDNRLPLFHDSCIYLQYRLAKRLSEIQEKKISSKHEMDCFIDFLKGTAGQASLSFWIAAEQMQLARDTHVKNSLLCAIRDHFLSSQCNNDFCLEIGYLVGLTVASLSQQKVTEAQDVVLSTLATYWRTRFRYAHGKGTNLTKCVTAMPSDYLSFQCCKIPTSKLCVASGACLLATSQFCTDNLLTALSFQHLSGSYLQKFLMQTQNKDWMGCYSCWFEVQSLKLSCSHNLHTNPCRSLIKQAKVILSSWSGTLKNVCDGSLKTVFSTALLRPHTTASELYRVVDQFEQFLVHVLRTPWTLLRTKDKEDIMKMPCYRLIHQQSTPLSSTSDVSIRNKEHITIDPKKPRIETKLKTKSLGIQEAFTFDRLIRNRVELEHFQQFLAERHVAKDLMLWIDVEEFLHIPDNEVRLRNGKAQLIKSKYLHKQYFFSSTGPASKIEQKKILLLAGGTIGNRPSTPVLTRAQASARSRIESRWLPMFTSGQEFEGRQSPQVSGISDVVEMVVSQQKWARRVLHNEFNDVEHKDSTKQLQKEVTPWKEMFVGKWTASSRDIVALRRGLLNPVICHQFRNFVSIKNDGNPFAENDILFWLEAEKLKQFCSGQLDMNLVYKKIQAVVSQFIDSVIPPALQVTIPQEMAHRLRGCVPSAGPCLMREAQDTVFRILFTHWLEFCKWKGQHQAGELPYDELKQEIHKLRRPSRCDGPTKWKPRSDSIFSRVSYDGRNDDNWFDDERGSKLTFTLSLYNETGDIYIIRNGKKGKLCKSVYSHVSLRDLFQSSGGHLPCLPKNSKSRKQRKTRFSLTDSI